MATRVRSRRGFSKRLVGGLIFFMTGITGGFFTSIGMDLYHTLRTAVLNQNGLSISVPQILFLLIGIAGLGLLLSAVIEPAPSARPRAKKRS
ncbi:MAG: hypothetical protein OK457_00305 [Thaumarchaeota archaeon]|nr:hypothetical protein [Nitrososphaerota archaeon]